MNQPVIKNPIIINFVYAIISESKRIKYNIFFNIVQTTEEKDGC